MIHGIGLDLLRPLLSSTNYLLSTSSRVFDLVLHRYMITNDFRYRLTELLLDVL